MNAERYARHFARKRYYKFHRKMLGLALRGLGINNYESPMISGEDYLVRKILRDKIRFAIDVGANEGNYAAALLSWNPNVRIWCIEPHPKTFKRLTSRFAETSNVSAHQIALGSQNGEAELYDYSHGEGSPHASCLPGIIERVHKSEASSISVDLQTLDTFVNRHQISKLDLLKIDAEGQEFAILENGLWAIRETNVTYIQFEFNEMNLISRTSLADFVDLLPDYTFHRLVPDGLVRIKNPLATENKIYVYQNILAVRRNGA